MVQGSNEERQKREASPGGHSGFTTEALVFRASKSRARLGGHGVILGTSFNGGRPEIAKRNDHGGSRPGVHGPTRRGRLCGQVKDDGCKGGKETARGPVRGALREKGSPV